MAATTYPRRTLGRDGPAVSAIGNGWMGLGSHSAYGKVPTEEEVFALFDRASELGSTFWDTSDLYGECEELLGRWFKKTGKRDQIFLATKFGYVKGYKTLKTDTSAEYTKKACEESLRVLGVDYIDLYYVHNVDPNIPIEETMRALLELKKQGKIKHIGISACSSNTLRRACKVGKVDAFQPEYSVYLRSIEGPEGTDLLATCRELGVGVVCACPLGRGLITSTFGTIPIGQEDENDRRVRTAPRFAQENREQNIKAVQAFGEIAAQKGCSPSQLALSWLLKQGDDIIPIPGTRRITYLEENWAAQGIELSDAEEAEIRAMTETAPVAGGQVSASYESFLYRDTREE